MRLFLVLAIMLASGSALGQDKPAGPIVWQVQNPFRYFKKAVHTEAHRKAFLALTEEQKAEPVLSIERHLAAKDSQRGWAGEVFEHVMDEACWYARPKKDQGKAKTAGPCGVYIKPQSHAVLLSAPTIPGPCTWMIAGQTLASKDCRQAVTATVPFGAESEVTLNTPGQVSIAKDTIEVDDVLVVGLGDSFAAGEGNPDRPVTFKRAPMDYEDAIQGYPKRAPPGKAAGWVHRNCHRSLYSHQLRVALQLAIEDPALHRSVTFVGLGCSGATILDLFEVYGGREKVSSKYDEPHSGRRHELSQLSILSHLLCQPNEAKLDEAVDYNADERLKLREKGQDKTINIYRCDADKRLRNVDLLLLSVGGNDVGFSGLVANASLKGSEMVLPELFDEDPRIEPAIAKNYLQRLPKRYEALGEALTAVLGKDAAGRVLLTAYPQIGTDEDGDPCRTGNRGFDVTKVWRLNKDVIAETETFADTELTPAMEKAAQDAGWRFVKEVRTGGKFRTHGICAANAAEKAEAAWNNDRFPRYSYGGRIGWAPYKADQFQPYKSRQRWIRTPNDAFMTAHYADTSKKLPELRVTGWSAYSGAFHPTAEGQAAIADAVMKSARDILAKRVRTAP
jgi:hypothetical protein